MHIQIDEIAKDFGPTTALHPVSLSIPSGALVALLGPSGSGKTTLLRILGGLEFPSSGRVLFNGQDATGMSVQDRRAGFVFQSYALFRHMNVRENIAYGLRARPRASRPNSAEIDRRVQRTFFLSPDVCVVEAEVHFRNAAGVTLVEPFVTTFRVERRGGEWRIGRVISSLGHINWTHGLSGISADMKFELD